MLSALMRRWLNRPKRSDSRPLARFFFADEEVTRVTMELNAVDLRKDPQKYLLLLNRLRVSQDQMLRSIELVMGDCIPAQRQSRDYHVKFPDEILHENLGVQLWFAAECLSAGSFLEVREVEGQRLRPLAEQVLQCLEEARMHLREQSLGDGHAYSPPLREALLRYDSAFSQFELSYVSTVIPVKSAEELQRQQEIVVLFCETVDRALKLGYLKQELIDGYEPLVMFTIPRLAIICGLLIFPEGPLNLQHGSQGMSSLFSPFYTLLVKIRDLLRILTKEELYVLEKSLCAAESSGLLCSAPPAGHAPTDYEPARAGDCGRARRRLFRNAHAFPAPLRPLTTPLESEPRPHSAVVDAEHVVIPTPPPQPGNVAEVQSGGPSTILHTSSSPEPASALPTPSAPPTTQPSAPPTTPPSAPPTTPPSAPPTTPPSAPPTTPPSAQPTTPPSATDSTPPPQTNLPTRPCPGEQTLNANASGLPAPVRERFYYYRSPAEPRAGSSAEQTWRPHRRQSWHCGQLPPGTDTRRLAIRHNAGHTSSRDLRARYSSSNDMVHRLFVCISGVADQLQTNFASDMRAILKSVFELIVSRDDSEGENVENKIMEEERAVEEDSGLQQEGCELCVGQRSGVPRVGNVTGPPAWVPDSACDRCMACHAPFTLLRRRHHCRSCGKIFCSRCSPNEAPLPRFGQRTPVRVCNHCFSFHIVGDTTQL